MELGGSDSGHRVPLQRSASDPSHREAVASPRGRMPRPWALAAIALLIAHSGQSQQQSGGAGQYVGDLVCQACHPQLASAFRANEHHDPAAAKKRPGQAGCESCHGPGGLHATSAGQAEITGFAATDPALAIDRCLSCHGGDLGKMHVRRSAHTTAEVGCTSCHSIHSSHPHGPLLAGIERQVCYGCHGEIRARFEMPFKHRVNEGALECSDCHNPHGAPLATWGSAHFPRMVSQGMGNDQPCLACHANLAGPFAFEHPPQRVEGCASCHEPHGSTTPRLLARPAVFVMCLECHNEIQGFGPRGDGIVGPTPGFHNLSDPVVRECVLCHSRIHGSNADPLFRR